MSNLYRILPILILLTACTSADDPRHRQVDQRLMEETSQVFSRSQVAHWQDVATWRFDSADALDDWSHDGFDLASDLHDGAWRLGASQFGAFFEHNVEADAQGMDAADIDRIVVTWKGTRKRPLRLQWAGPGEEMSQQRTLEMRGKDDAGRYMFELATHPHWKGPISSLRWTPRLPSKLRGRLESVVLQRSVPSPDRRRQTALRPFKVTLGQTSRTARVVLPGAPWTKTVEVEDGHRLEAAVGVDKEIGGEVTFQLEAVTEDGGDVTRLFTATAGGPSASKPGFWHPLEVDLSPWAGQTLELRFYAEGAPAETAYGFWGGVQLTRPHSGEPLPNVVLVVLDTLRADHLSHYGYERPTSPKLEAWADRRAVSFRQAVAAAPWTYPSHLSLFTGLDPITHGQHHPRPLPRRFELLAQHLQKAGYETLAVTAGGYLDAHYGFARGFDRYHVVQGHLGPKGDLEKGIEQAERWMESAHRPYFLFLHTYEVHTPHRVRQPFHRQLSGRDGDGERLARLTPRPLPEGDVAGAVKRKTYAFKDGEGGFEDLKDGELQHVVDAYDSAIAYADHHVMDFLQRLEDRDGPALTVITSDHGEALGEHGLADHAYLYDVNLHIPLVMALPDSQNAGTWIDPQVRQIDVLPTILNALDLPVPSMDGRSLLPYLEGRTPDLEPADALAWSATAYQGVSLRRGNRLKYVFNPTLWQRDAARQALFLLDDDPDEAHNRASDHPAVEELERMAIERTMQNLDGLLVSFDHGGSDAVRVRFRGPHWLGPQFFKSVDAPPGALGLDGRNVLDVRVTPGARFSVVLEQVASRDFLAIDIEGPEGPCTATFPLLDAAPIIQHVLGADCSVGADDLSDAFSLSLIYHHGREAGVGDEEMPAELVDQLRALGYLD